ncbi:MAG: hypothetical protein ACKVP7_21440 [Hyphomicrobiaceae bacterium]
MGFLTDAEIAALNPSELLPHATPIQTQIVSSDDFTPTPQSDQQRQIEALRRLEIPEDMQKAHGFKPIGAADGPIRTAIFGGTNAKLYGYDMPKRGDIGPDHDSFAIKKAEYEHRGPTPSNLRYGYVAGPVDWSAFA